MKLDLKNPARVDQVNARNRRHKCPRTISSQRGEFSFHSRTPVRNTEGFCEIPRRSRVIGPEAAAACAGGGVAGADDGGPLKADCSDPSCDGPSRAGKSPATGNEASSQFSPEKPDRVGVAYSGSSGARLARAPATSALLDVEHPEAEASSIGNMP